MTTNWFKSDQDGGIHYAALQDDINVMPPQLRNSITIDRVIFRRFNVAAGVDELVSIHWTQAFKWADADPCGGLGLDSVKLSDGSECFARGLYWNTGEGGLASITVGCYGPVWMKRDCRPARDKHGFPVHPIKAVSPAAA